MRAAENLGRFTNLGTTATPAWRLQTVSFTAWDPDKPGGAGMHTVPVATYTYTTFNTTTGTGGHLATIADPRTATDPADQLTTTYTYNTIPAGLTAPPLASVTEPGLSAWRYTYGSTSQGSNGLLRVSRDPADGSTGTPTTQAAFVYGINPTTLTTGLPSMTAAAVEVWDQTTAPTWGAAVFTADHPVTTAAPAGITAADWPYADLAYTDANGRVINTAAYGAGNWQLTATTYNEDGGITQTLDGGAIDQIRTQAAAGHPVDPAQYATIIRYNTDITASTDIAWDGGTLTAGTLLVSAGSRITDAWGPVAPSGQDGNLARAHVHVEYDQGVPGNGVDARTGMPYGLQTTTTIHQAAPDSGSSDPAVPVVTGEPVVSQTRTGYDPIDGSPATGDTAGWTLGIPTTTTTPMSGAGADITARTLYDATGRTIQTRQPASNGTDAGTWNTVYYTAAANSTHPQCGNKPAWDGWVCLHRTGESTPTIATTQVSGLNLYGQPTSITETLDGATRTTTTGYDDAGRVLTTHVTVTGLTGTEPLPTSRNEYDLDTGLPIAVASVDGTTVLEQILTGYDSWGRTISYTDTDGAVTTTGYNTAGQVASITDPTGTLTWIYDGTDANGLVERRGLPTAMTVTNATGPLTLTAAYNAAGNIVLETFPGNLQVETTYDRAGQQNALAYTGNGPQDRIDLFAFTLTRDAEGDIIGDTSPTNTRTFANDNAGRLVAVTDTMTTDLVPVCTLRTYGYDTNGNRTTAGAAAADAGDPCAPTPASNRVWEYDDADRVQTGANTTGTYTYDDLGRQTILPAVDTPAGSTAGDLTLSYYVNDLAHTIAQGGSTTTYTLDPAQRRAVATIDDGASSTVIERHYTDTSDNPAWATSTDGTTAATTRYVGSLTGGLGITITNDSPSLAVADPHGTIRTTISIPTIGDAGTATAWTSTDEFGRPLNREPASTGVVTYNWHGQEERAYDQSGLTLMGSRLYNYASGQFTTRDPVHSGNMSAYSYAGDPLNERDLDGNQLVRSTSRYFEYQLVFRVGLLKKNHSQYTVMSALKWNFNKYFPIRGAKRILAKGVVMHLWARGFIYAPVKVWRISRTSWTFGTEPGHFDGPAATIRFTLTNSNGYLYLYVTGRCPFCGGTPYRDIAVSTWSPFDRNLRKLL